MNAEKRPGITPAKDIPPGPRGLAGYCWAKHPTLGVHCCHPIGHEQQGAPAHLHPYTSPATSWK